MKLAIVGSRNFNDQDYFNNIIDLFINENGLPSMIISGGASGADTLAKNYAVSRNIPLIEHLPDWSKGRCAGPERNTKIVNDCDVMIAFPSKESKGTFDSIRKCQKMNKKVLIYYID